MARSTDTRSTITLFKAITQTEPDKVSGIHLHSLTRMPGQRDRIYETPALRVDMAGGMRMSLRIGGRDANAIILDGSAAAA